MFKMKKKKFIIVSLTVIITVGALILWRVHKDNRKFVTFTYSNSFNSTYPFQIFNQSNINTIFPLSLWHNENEILTRNDRIEFQRKWIEYLSNSDIGRIPIKNILVLTRVYRYTYYVKSENDNHMCPSHFSNLTYNMNDKCNFVRTVVTKNWSPPANLSAYDAVLTTIYGVIRFVTPPSLQNPPQQIYFSLEPPHHSGPLGLSEVGSNVVLVSYESNADISIPYGKWVTHANSLKHNANSSFVKKKNYASKKAKMVAMLVSNCSPRNNRMEYAYQLRDHVQVDIYGRCSENKKCKPNCSKMLKNEYKFYLAFENSNCRDYITEKLFTNAFQNDIIPIVMGAHPEDYKAVAPPNSYIHVEDFPSPRALAEYLKLLSNDDNLYNKYFEWKGTGEFIDTINDLFCRVCAMIIYSDFQPNPKRPMDSILHSTNHCLPKNVWYWNR